MTTRLSAGGLSTLVGLAAVTGACALGSARPLSPADVPKERLAVVRRAQVWTPTNVRAMNLKAGPRKSAEGRK